MTSPDPATPIVARVADPATVAVALAELASLNLVYAQPAFLDFLARATGGRSQVVLAQRGDSIVGALPFLTLEKAGIGRVVNSLPWYGSHGGCILDRHHTEADDIRRALLTGFSGAIAGPDLLSATVVLPHSEEPRRALYFDALAPSAIDSRISQITPLPKEPDDDALLTVFDKKTRNLVRKGMKQGFEERVADDDAAWEFLFRTHATNMAALGGVAKPPAHFAALRATLPASMRRLSLALENGAPVAALLLVGAGQTIEYLTPVVEVTARPRQPLSFLIVNGMRDAISRGYRNWNWGGTWHTQHTLHHFKAGFGGVDHPYSYLVVAPPRGVAILKANRATLGALFPYFYTYPYAAFDDPA